MRKFVGHEGQLNTAIFSPDGRFIATTGSGGDFAIFVWGVARWQQVRKLSGHEHPVWSLAYNHDGSQLISASSDRTALLWSLNSPDRPLALCGHTGWVTGAIFSPDRRWIVTVGSNGTTRLWDAATGYSMATLFRHTDQLWEVAFSPDGSDLVIVAADNVAIAFPCDACGSVEEVPALIPRRTTRVDRTEAERVEYLR